MIRPVRNEILTLSAVSALQRSDGKARACDVLAKELQKKLADPNHLTFAAFNGKAIEGFFAFSPYGEDSYLVMTEWLCDSEQASREMLSHLKQHFSGYEIEFNLRPDERKLITLLRESGASVFPEQQNMKLTRIPPATDTEGIELLSEPYLGQYIALHENSDAYLDGEAIAAAAETHHALLAIENGTVAGYLDLTCGNDVNGITDLYVEESRRNRGWGAKLLARAIEINRPNGLTLQVDVDNSSAIHLYEKMGFTVVPGENCIDALWEI